MIFYRHINLALASAFVSIGAGFVSRMFPEKIVLLLLIRLAVVLAVACFWKYDEDNRSLYTFLFVGINIGFLISFWDEVVLLFSVYPIFTTLLTMILGFSIAGVIVYVSIKSNAPKL